MQIFWRKPEAATVNESKFFYIIKRSGAPAGASTRPRQQREQDADGHVQQKHPAPREIVGNPAAEGRPDRRRKDDGDALGAARQKIAERGLRNVTLHSGDAQAFAFEPVAQ